MGLRRGTLNGGAAGHPRAIAKTTTTTTTRANGGVILEAEEKACMCIWHHDVSRRDVSVGVCGVVSAILITIFQDMSALD